ncbi:MAG: HDOD domain-containing protein [Thermodesulfobacteriota bacterium]
MSDNGFNTPVRELRGRIFRIERLSALPQSVWRLLEAIGDRNTDAARLEAIISDDPSLASKVLSLANSAYYSRAQKVTTIRRAIVVIGLDELQLLVVGSGLADLFDVTQAPPDFDGPGLWSHCVAVSWMARELAQTAQYPEPAEVMLAGLLHDLGKLVLITHLKEEFYQVLGLVRQGMPYYEAEETLGLRHTEIGDMLAASWRIPEVQRAAIRFHHAPRTSDPYLTSTSIVCLADVLVKAVGLGVVHQARAINVSVAMDELKLTRDRLRDLAVQAKGSIPPMLEAWRQVMF